MKIIKGGLVVSGEDSRRLDIAVEAGRIAAIEPNIRPGPGDAVIDAENCLLFPGFIDAHTHFDLNTGTAITADDFKTGTLAALCGGTTTVVDFATQDRGMTLAEALSIWHRKAEGVSSCNYAFHMAITDWNERTRRELRDMVDAGVTSFKLYMAYDALRVGDDAILDILLEMRKIGALCGVHCENGALVNFGVNAQKAAGHMGPSAHPISRPPEVEAEAVSRLLYLSRMAEWPVCVVHLSTALGLREIGKARRLGQRVVVETCPQYLSLTGEKYALPGFEGAKFVCSPPLRGEADRQALIEAVQDGRIDTIATDHCSFNYRGQKELGKADFSKIPNGLPGVEHRPALVYSQLVEPGLISPERMCQLLSENPAKLYGMYPKKGALRVGSDADIAVFARGLSETISASTQHQNVDYTPYEGMRISGRAKSVLLGGELAVDDYQIVKPGLGRYVGRSTPDLS